MKQWITKIVVALALCANSVAFGRNYTQQECPAIGNSETRIYHIPRDRNYGQMLQENKDKKNDNRVCFKSRSEAEKAGYRRSMSGKGK